MRNFKSKIIISILVEAGPTAVAMDESPKAGTELDDAPELIGIRQYKIILQ